MNSALGYPNSAYFWLDTWFEKPWFQKHLEGKKWKEKSWKCYVKEGMELKILIEREKYQS